MKDASESINSAGDIIAAIVLKVDTFQNFFSVSPGKNCNNRREREYNGK